MSATDADTDTDTKFITEIYNRMQKMFPVDEDAILAAMEKDIAPLRKAMLERNRLPVQVGTATSDKVNQELDDVDTKGKFIDSHAKLDKDNNTRPMDKGTDYCLSPLIFETAKGSTSTGGS